MSSKLSTFICQNCGTETSQYFGKCLNCKSWNSIVEEIKSKRSKHHDIKNNKKSIPFNEISSKKISRFTSGFSEFDRVLQQKWPLWLQELVQQTGYVRSRVLRIPVHHVSLCISRQFEWLGQHQRRSRGEQQAVSLSLNEASFISNYVHKNFTG